MNIGGPPVTCSVHYASNYAGQKADGLTWIGTTEERVGFDNEPTMEARERIIREVGEFFPPALTGKVVHQTACLRPVAPDGLPVIGPVPGWEGVYLSTGAGRKGIILSPSMGKLTAGNGSGQRRRNGNRSILPRPLHSNPLILSLSKDGLFLPYSRENGNPHTHKAEDGALT